MPKCAKRKLQVCKIYCKLSLFLYFRTTDHCVYAMYHQLSVYIHGCKISHTIKGNTSVIKLNISSLYAVNKVERYIFTYFIFYFFCWHFPAECVHYFLSACAVCARVSIELPEGVNIVSIFPFNAPYNS